MRHREYPYWKNSEWIFSNVQQPIAKCRFKKSRVKSTRVLGNEHSGTFPLEKEMIDIQVLMCPKDKLSWEPRIVDDYKQEKYTKACIYDWVHVILELYDIGRERYARQIVDLLHTKNIELNKIQVRLKDIFACIRFVGDTSNEQLKINRIYKLSGSTECTSATVVSIVYEKKVVEILKN